MTQLLTPGGSVRRLRVGRAAGGGKLQVNGGELTVTDDFLLNEGGARFASTTVQLGGIITAPATIVGYSTSGAILTITGAGSTFNATTSFVVGRATEGILQLIDGGTLAIGNGTLPLQIATLASSHGIVVIGGGPAGVLQASAVQFGAGNGQLEFAQSGNLTFATPITGAGNIINQGPGTTTLSAINSYTGRTTFIGGTLAISADGNLGTPPASFNVNQLQFFGGTLRATESFTLAATRGILLENSWSGSFEVDATKTLTLPNSFSLPSGTMTKTGAASTSGTFDALQFPTLAGALVWNTSQLYTTGVLSVTSTVQTADFDEDGDVDGDDLTRWRTNFGTGATHVQGNADGDADVDGADLLVWQRQLGSPPITAAAEPVPEPGALILVSMAGCGLALLRRRPR